MSTSELEPLGLDAAVITKLQAIGSDQLGDDAITEKLTELFGGNRPDDITPAVGSFPSKEKVEVSAREIRKSFIGQWKGIESTIQSNGKLYYSRHRELKGRYAIVISLSTNAAVIAFKKVSDPQDEPQPGQPVPLLPVDAVFRGNPVGVEIFVPVKGSGRWD